MLTVENKWVLRLYLKAVQNVMSGMRRGIPKRRACMLKKREARGYEQMCRYLTWNGVNICVSMLCMGWTVPPKIWELAERMFYGRMHNKQNGNKPVEFLHWSLDTKCSRVYLIQTCKTKRHSLTPFHIIYLSELNVFLDTPFFDVWWSNRGIRLLILYIDTCKCVKYPLVDSVIGFVEVKTLAWSVAMMLYLALVLE